MDQKEVERLTVKTVKHLLVKHGDCDEYPSIEQVKAMLALEGSPVPHLTENGWLFKHISLYWAAARDQFHKKQAEQGALKEATTDAGKMLEELEIDEVNMDVNRLIKDLELNPQQAQQLQQIANPPKQGMMNTLGNVAKGAAIGAGAVGIGALLAKSAANMTPEQKAKAIQTIKTGGQNLMNGVKNVAQGVGQTAQQLAPQGAAGFMNPEALKDAVEQVKTHGKNALKRMEPGLQRAVDNIMHGRHPAEGSEPNMAGVPNESASPAAQLLSSIDELTPQEAQRLQQFVSQHPGNQPGSGNQMATGTGQAPQGASYAQGAWHQELNPTGMASNVQPPVGATQDQGSQIGSLLSGQGADPLDKLAAAIQPELQGSEQVPNSGVDTLMRETPNPATVQDSKDDPWKHGE